MIVCFHSFGTIKNLNEKFNKLTIIPYHMILSNFNSFKIMKFYNFFY